MPTKFKQCRSCQQPFEITLEEQERLRAIGERSGWERLHLPTRCQACRDRENAEAELLEAKSGLTRKCRECGRGFVVSPEEMRLLEEIAERRQWARLRVPRSCTPCRSARRRARYRVTPGEPEKRQCMDCGQGFLITASEREAYAAQGQCWPRRCDLCRAALASVRASASTGL